MINTRALTAIVLAACLCTGFWIARHKPLWNDEFFSQVSSDSRSYMDMFLGRIGEGSNAPLSYAIQKAFLQMVHYHTPAAWEKGVWVSDRSSEILLRVTSVIFMSLSMALVFYYFTRRYSLLIGLYSLFIYGTSYMLWVYWAEARPYALVTLLTTVQSVLFLKMMEGDGRAWKPLAVVNILSAFTFIFSIGQVAAVSLLLWVLKKERDWRKYIFLAAIPVAIALFYYAHAPRYPFFFDLTPEQLVRDNMSREKFYILFIFAFLLLWRRNTELLRPLAYFLFTLLMVAFTAGALWLFSLHQCQPDKGFPVSNRYFIYLMPAGVIAATALSVAAVRSLSPYRLLQLALAAGIGFLLAQRFIKIVPRAIHSLLGG